MCRNVAETHATDQVTPESRKVERIKFTRLQEMKCFFPDLMINALSQWSTFVPYSGFPARTLLELLPREENGVCCNHVERISIR